MAAKKLLVLKGVTPPGFTYKQVVKKDGKLVVEEKCNICHAGHVIVFDAEECAKRMGQQHLDWVERAIAAGIVAPAAENERLTDGKVATYGDYLDAKSGPEKPDVVPAKADKVDK
jgi:cytochrome c5